MVTTTNTTQVSCGYKPTEIGDIPEDWDVKQLGELGECIIGLTYHPENVKSDGLLVLRSSNIADNSLDFTDNVYVDVAVSEKLIVRKGDILICVRNGSRNLIGKCALIDDRAVGMTFGAFMSVYRTRRPEFVYYLLQSDIIKRQIHENIGATINQITNRDLRNFRIPLPRNEHEQDLIVDTLKDMDRLLGSLDRLIVKKHGIKQAMMQQLLAGEMRLPGFNGQREVKRLGDVAAIKTGKRNNEEKSDGGAYPFFVRSQAVERINSYSFDGEAILVPGEGGIGTIFHYINGRFDYHQRVYKISNFTADMSGKFIYYYMKLNFYSHAMQNTVKATVDSLRLPTFQAFEILAPPLEEQQAIVAVLSDMDGEIATLEQQRDKTQALKQGMMQELLTGRRRLV